jgi:hypothetical protein
MAAVAKTSEAEPAVVPTKADNRPGALGFASDTYTVSESDSMARVTVRRRGGAAGKVSFAWHTADDSALAGEDYASAEGRETMRGHDGDPADPDYRRLRCGANRTPRCRD